MSLQKGRDLGSFSSLGWLASKMLLCKCQCRGILLSSKRARAGCASSRCGVITFISILLYFFWKTSRCILNTVLQIPPAITQTKYLSISGRTKHLSNGVINTCINSKNRNACISLLYNCWLMSVSTCTCMKRSVQTFR